MTGSASAAARLARAAFSRLAEPQDSVASALIAVAGPVDALRVATGTVHSGRRLEEAVADELGRTDADGALVLVADAVARWAPRVRTLAPARDIAVVDRLGGWLLTPEDEHWPAALDDLGPEAPLCLWGRGHPPDGLPPVHRAVAVVGSRDSTAYGDAVSADLSHGLASAGLCVVSGGAFGIDAQAHRGVLAAVTDNQAPGVLNASMPTVAVMACGVDRFYPAAHESLLRQVIGAGCLVSEVAPGSSPTRWRFLQRNRLIAALAAVTVVVEARWRSGALNTAHHAAGLGREVAAVPGSVHSATSAGCHRLLREGNAVCVTDVADVRELLSPYSPSSGPVTGETGVRETPAASHDGLDPRDLVLYDALPVRSGSTTAKLAVVAGLSEPAVRAGLGRLSLRGLAVGAGGAWRKGPVR